MHSLPPALQPLGAWAQFVAWIAVPHPTKPGKFNKFPVNWQTGDVIDTHNPAYWTTAACALAMAPQWDRGYGSGAGFVFTEADPFFFHDIDGAYDHASGQWSPLAIELVGRLDGCAIETSHSGTGLHVIGRTAALAHGCKNQPLGLELYTSGRFVALTGTHARGDVAHDASVPLAAIVAEYFAPHESGKWENWTVEPVEGWLGPADDDALLTKALASAGRSAAAVFGGAPAQPTFIDLWEARADVLAARWPGEPGKPFGQSEAEQALANMLAFWTGKNCDRMERLMRRSAMARDKWDQHRTYLADTILKACAFVQNVYAPPADAVAPLVASVAPEVMVAAARDAGRQLREPNREYMGPHEQLTFFEGCYFDNTTAKIYSIHHNTEFSRIAFDINFGGHMFIMDPANQKTTDSAWTAYTMSRVNKPMIVDALCFRPERRSGDLITDGNRLLVNSYVPHEPRRVAGDPSKFLNHLAKILPVASDRVSLLSYLASMAQNPGKKFQWWPVIQGAQGNGKSIIGLVMTNIIGQQYTHQPNTHVIAREGMKFNSWLYRKLLIILEEIMISKKRDLLDELKVVVTGKRSSIERKGQDQFDADNRANGILFTNHRDAIPVTVDDRRWAIYYCAQQCAEDVMADGLTDAYFRDLIDWIEGTGTYAQHGDGYGAAIMCNYLLSLEIAEELDPAKLCLRAPRTSSTEEAVIASFGPAEQEVLNAIDEGRPGFANGWVSSRYLDQLLDQIGVRIQRNKRQQMMRTIGYVPHPALADGRVADPVAPDNMKPRLYIRRDHPAFTLKSGAEVGRAYTAAQMPDAKGTAEIAELVFKPPHAA